MPFQYLTDDELRKLGDDLLAAMPVLDPDGQRIAVATYRLLAAGAPVTDTRLAESVALPLELHVDGRRLWGWCAWDTLFLPIVLGRSARIDSVCASTRKPVRAVVGPDGVEDASEGTVISFLRPTGAFDQDVIASFCHDVLFFSSDSAGEQWIGGRDDHFLLSLEQGFELGKRVWKTKLAAVLAPEREAA